ncbi:MAG: two-component system response regulator [Methylotenera sp.]|nr:MAG: two-component system response regulator [Methylotenera sp.]
MQSLKHILLAEDNLEDIQLTLEALEGCRLANHVMVVRDGADALDYLYRRNRYKDRNDVQPMVIFLDIKMPKIDGVEVLRQIKADQHLRMIPVVMVTSSREQRDLLSSYQLGANSYVVKPIDFSQFVKAIQELGLYWAVLNELPLESK